MNNTLEIESNDNSIDNSYSNMNRTFSKKEKPCTGIPITRVLNKEQISSLGEIYKCNICFNIMVNPTDCEKCGHSYCLDCISNYKCPFNCNSTSIKPSSVGIKMILTQIVFKCLNEGCNDKISYSNIVLHDQECEFKQAKCPSPNCGLVMNKKDLENHIKNECQHVLINCQHCNNDFFKYEFKDHFEDCEHIFNTLFNENNSTLPKKSSNLNNNYIEALSMNISKIIKENEKKFNTISEENQKIKEELNNNFQNIISKVNINQNESNKDSNTNFILSLREELSSIHLTNLNEIIEKNNESLKHALSEIQKEVKEFKIKLSEQTKIIQNEEVLSSVKDIINSTENTINSNIEDVKNNIIEKLSQNSSIKNDIKQIESSILSSSNEENLKINNKIKELYDIISTGKTDYEKECLKINENISKVFNIIQSINIELQENKKKSIENIESDTSREKLEELESINESITLLSKSVKQIKSLLTEEFAEIANSVGAASECICANHKEILNILKEVDNKNEIRLEDLQKHIESSFESKLKEMYNLKWCNECSKVDYFFGFIKCTICISETCKQCVLLCKDCKVLYCKKCVECPKKTCNGLSCTNCRVACFFCSKQKSQTYCKTCINDCNYCHKSTCVDCVKNCLECKNLTCGECAKYCYICTKSACRRCDSSKAFKQCFYCNKQSCFDCIVTCKFCDLEVCTNCFLSCRQCKKSICKRCRNECSLCSDSFCNSCSKELNSHKCSFCKKTFCITCTKVFRKCKGCGESACKDCHTMCKKCKNIFCANCNLTCDNCGDSTCVTCVYECVCDKVFFCEKCLFDVKPIGQHLCVSWLNRSSKFIGTKTRSYEKLPRNFEAKLYLEKCGSDNLIIGITDNSSFDEDSISFFDNIWAFKTKTGQKFSSKNGLEYYYDKEAREKDFIIVAIKNDNLYFRVNFDDNPPAFALPPNKDYYLYIENDTSSDFSDVCVQFIYIRKI